MGYQLSAIIVTDYLFFSSLLSGEVVSGALGFMCWLVTLSQLNGGTVILLE